MEQGHAQNENVGIVPPVAYFRQQYSGYEDNEGNERLIDVINLDVLVYPKYDGDLVNLKKLSIEVWDVMHCCHNLWPINY